MAKTIVKTGKSQAPQPHPLVEKLGEEGFQWLVEEDIVPPVQGQHMSESVLDLYMDNVLGRARSVQRERQRNKEVYEARLAELQAWYDRVEAPLTNRLRWLDGLLAPLIVLVRFPGKAKSRMLPNGRIGMRTMPARVDIADAKAAVVFCKTHKLSIKEEPYKKPILAWIKNNPKLLNVVLNNGIVYHEPSEKQYWETLEHKDGKANEGADAEDAHADE